MQISQFCNVTELCVCTAERNTDRLSCSLQFSLWAAVSIETLHLDKCFFKKTLEITLITVKGSCVGQLSSTPQVNLCFVR